MEYRRLGTTELELSVVGFGGIPIQRVDEQTVRDILTECKAQGINFIDTARGYTVSEELIGKALKDHKREDFYLATKSMQRSRDGILREIETSLKNLDVDAIDLFQFHNIKSEEEYEKLLKRDGGYGAILELKDQGVIKHIGMSTHSSDFLAFAIETDRFESVQFPFNPVEQQGYESLKKAKEKGLGVIIMKPVAGGAIHHKDLAIRDILSNEFVTCVIPGMDSVQQVKMNVLSANNKSKLSLQERQQLDDEIRELGSCFCRRCGYCSPCSVGIDIPFNFLLEGYYTRYHLEDWAKERYDALETKAGDCIECGDCMDRCPYDLEIISMLKNTDKILSKR